MQCRGWDLAAQTLAIIATRDVSVRIKFYNLLPSGAGGDLFIPVDTTVMGAGHGPLGHNAMPMHYTQNRANVHLHGNNTVWISDGTPHQWITPAGEDTPYPEGVSVVNVPDMENVDDPRDGVQTLYYTNAQSARLMFYHDHSYGITQMYVADPAGYSSPDTGFATEVKMVSACGIPGLPADWPSGVPDPALKGPDWLQIGTESGFMPAPVVIPSQPITWNLNATTFNAGNVDQHSLLLGTAERADVTSRLLSVCRADPHSLQRCSRSFPNVRPAL